MIASCIHASVRGKSCLARFAAAAGLTAVFSAASIAQCAPTPSAWTAAFEGPADEQALNSTVGALSTWDPDGPGPITPRLIVGGSFTLAGGAVANRVAQWDGSSWQTFGTGISSGFAFVALGWDPDGTGPLLPQPAFGGFFATIGGVTTRNVAHWDGTAWQPFAGGTNDVSGLPDVYAMANWDADGDGPGLARLVIGGDFTTAGGSRRRIAIWDGTAWQALGAGFNDSVYSLTTWDPDGSGPLNDHLIAGGFFASAGAAAIVNRIARWDGAAWQAMGAGLDGSVEALTTWDPDGPGPLPAALVAGGPFTTSGGAAVNRIAMWDGAAWQPLGSGFDDGTVFTLTTFDPDGSGPANAQLVAGGSFLASGGVAVNHVARWDGTAWNALGSGMNSTVFEVTTWDADGPGPAAAGLVAGGLFTTAGGVSAGRLALWPATSIGCPADTNCSGDLTVQDIFDFLGAYFAGAAAGDFNGVGGITVQDIFDFLNAYFAGCP